MFKEFKNLFKHSLIYGLGNIISRAVGFLLIPVYTRYLLPKDYGILEILSIISTMAGIFIGMGLSSAALRYYFEYDEEIEKKQVFSTALITSTLLVFIAVFLLSRFSNNFSRIFFGSIEYEYFFTLTFITMFFEATIEILFAFIRARERSGTFVIISIVKLILALSLSIYMVVFLKKGVIGVLYSNLAAVFCTWSILILITIKYCGFNFSKNKLKELVIYGSPLIMVSCGMYILSSMDRIFLNRYSTLTVVGLYSLGYKFAMIIKFLVVSPFMSGYGPYRFSIMRKDNAKEIYSRVLTYFSFFLIFVGLLIAILIKEILIIMTTPPFYEAHKVVPIFIMGAICYGIYFIIQTGIYLQKRTESIAYIIMIVALINLLLNWVLIPKFGMIGAAWINFLSYFILTLITQVISQKYYLIKYDYGRIVQMVTVAVLFYFFSLLINIQNIAVSILVKILLVCLFPYVLFLINFYQEEEIRKLKEIKERILLFLLNKRKNIAQEE